MYILKELKVTLIGPQTIKYAQATTGGWVFVSDINAATALSLAAVCTLKLAYDQHLTDTMTHYEIMLQA